MILDNFDGFLFYNEGKSRFHKCEHMLKVKRVA